MTSRKRNSALSGIGDVLIFRIEIQVENQEGDKR